MTTHEAVAKMVARLIEREDIPESLVEGLYRALDEQQIVYAHHDNVTMPIPLFEALLVRAMRSGSELTG
jgi:hypothetical protein